MTAKSFYTSHAWRRKRAAYLRLHPICTVDGCAEVAMEVDHVIALSRGGLDASSNYQPLCKSHHSRKTRRDQRGGDDPEYVDGPRGERVIRIVGAPASGKSTLRQRLASDLGLPSFDVHEERLALLRPGEAWPEEPQRAWEALDRAIRAHPDGSVVETGGNTRHEERLYERRQVMPVVCIATTEVRRQRLLARAAQGGPLVGDAPRYVASLLAQTTPIVAGSEVYADDGYDALLDRARGFVWGGSIQNGSTPADSHRVSLSYPTDAPGDLIREPVRG